MILAKPVVPCQSPLIGSQKQERFRNTSQQEQEAADRRKEAQALLVELDACTAIQNLERGKNVHAEVVKCGHDSNIFVASALVHMYAKCGSMVDAHQVFDSMEDPDVVLWTALIMGYALNGQGQKALDMFARMKTSGPAPNAVTMVAAIKACTSLAEFGEQAKCRDLGKDVHDLAVQNGCDSNIYVQNTLIDMYAKCGIMASACNIFDSIQHPNAVSWNALILGYADNGEGQTALGLFKRMKCRGTAITSLTLVAALKACTTLALIGGAGAWAECSDWGKHIHYIAVENGFISNIYVQNTLIDMYANCGNMVDARRVFDSIGNPNVVSWNVLALGYADNGQCLLCLEMFSRMRRAGGVPNPITFLAVLKALAGASGLECRDWGRGIHNLAVENGCDSNIYVQNTLINMYANCGSMVDALQVFDIIKHPSVVSLNAMIFGYAENGQGVTALELFTRMRDEGPAPDSVTFSGALKACTLLGALEFGRTIHSEIDRGKEHDLVLLTCLVDFYAKCGSLVEAQSVFDLYAETRNTITWTALLAGFSSCGDHESVFKMFEAMQDAGVQPDSISFVPILACCSHGGLVDKGREWFKNMSTKYGIIPTVEHYNCMLDMFGRLNMLDDAMALLERMHCNPDAVTWTTILAACRKWKNVAIARLAFQSSIHFNGESADRDASSYVLMGQIYGSRGMLQEQEMVMQMRKKSCP